MEDNPMVVCIRNNIKVYPIIYDLNHLKIEIDYDGRKKQGEEIYNWKTQQKQLQNKIIELYEILAQNIQSRK
jgi:hypothetical protein